MRYRSLSPFLQPQILFTTNEPQSYVFGGRNHPLHSNSQKTMLKDYAKRNGFLNCQFYVDDGYSGTNYDRPAFRQLIEDIQDGEVSTLITKDLSRLGRNYLETGTYIEVFFPNHNVRYIAINDSWNNVQKIL